MWITFILAILVFVMFVMYVRASAEARKNVQITYVKMFRDGSWDVDFADQNREVEFLPATVNSILTSWVQRCFREDPSTVGQDYGFCALLMSKELAGAFMDPKQFNAPHKAAEIRDKTSAPKKEIAIRTINHFDSEKATFGRAVGQFYRTNVFVVEQLVNDNGTLVSSTRKIAQLRWRLLPKNEITARMQAKNGQEWLRVDPIGLEVLDYQYLDDPSENSDNNSRNTTP
jgi:hypothetical protein